MPLDTKNKKCPTCGKTMKEQFIGVQHCICGTKWTQGIGFFKRDGNTMVSLHYQQANSKAKYPSLNIH